MKPTCTRCGERPTARRSDLCPTCHAALRTAGLKWCPGCRQAIARALFGAQERCRACKARQMRGRAAASARRCVLCGTRPPQRNSTAICGDCRAVLVAAGQRWCQAGKHVVEDVDYGASRACLACERERQARYGRVAQQRCAICQAPLAGHPRCAGCGILLHGQPAPLCRLCARDRAAGVPPQGYSWREEAHR